MKDAVLSSAAKVVYTAIATRVSHGNIAFIGQRMIADLTSLGVSTASRAIRQLIKAGYVKVRLGGNGKRNCYELTSPVFAQKLREGERVLVKDAKSGHIRNVGEGPDTRLVSGPRSYIAEENPKLV
jgi:hypothetical protein